MHLIATEKADFNRVVYTPLDEAVTTLRSRKPGMYATASIPEPFLEGNCAVLARFVTTPNYEVLRFLKLAASYGLTPILIEYPSDKFVGKNAGKRALAKMGFYNGCGRKGGRKIEWMKVIDFNTWHGKYFSDIVTVWGESFAAFHRRLFFREFPDFPPTLILNISDWYLKMGGSASIYYEPLLTIFLSNAILFETYLFDPSEITFSRDIVLPAFCRVKEQFGIRPLITPLDPPGQEGDEYWTLYPAHLRQHVHEHAKA
jgi:hypothetical protein